MIIIETPKVDGLRVYPNASSGPVFVQDVPKLRLEGIESHFRPRSASSRVLAICRISALARVKYIV